jgi:hypothetical protein
METVSPRYHVYPNVANPHRLKSPGSRYSTPSAAVFGSAVIKSFGLTPVIGSLRFAVICCKMNDSRSESMGKLFFYLDLQERLGFIVRTIITTNLDIS